MSYYQSEPYARGWTSVEDIEKSLVSASRITQGSDGGQRAYVPQIPAPLDPQNELPADPFSIFNLRHTGPLTIMGRGQMIIEKEMACNVVLRDQRISRELSKAQVPGMRGYCDSAAQEIITSSGQFDDCDEVHPEEPYFENLKVTSTPSSSTIKEPVDDPHTGSPTNISPRLGIDFSDHPQDSVAPNDIESASASQPNPICHPNTSSDHQETSLDAPHSYSDHLYYSFDESVFIKMDPIVPLATEAPTPSPCSSPLPDHSALDGHFVGCIQMESDSSSSPSPIFDLNHTDMSANKNASDFVTQLRKTLPDDYHEVMSIWKDFQSSQISYSALEIQIARLLGPYPDLIDAFFKFTSLSPSEEPESLIGESFNGEMSDVLESSNQLNSEADHANRDAICDVAVVPDVLASQVIGEPFVNSRVAMPDTAQANLFEDYTKFCRLVRNKFADQPDVFAEFLALLNDHRGVKIDEKSLIDGATRLFYLHQDLIEDLKKLTSENFSSVLFKTAGSVAAHSTLKKVGRLTDSTRPRRCRNALILNLLKKEKASNEEPAIPADLSPVEVVPIRRVGDEGKFGGITCDLNGPSDVGESVNISIDSDSPSSTTLCYSSAGVETAVVSSTVFDDNGFEPCGLNSVQTDHSCDSTTDELKLKVTDFGGVSPSLPLCAVNQDEPLELLKPEDIIPDMNSDVPHCTLERLQEISSLVDNIVTQEKYCVSEEVASEENDLGASELLKPEDIIPEMCADELLGTLETAEKIVTPVTDTIEIQDVVGDSVESSELLKPENIIQELGPSEIVDETVTLIVNTVVIQDVEGDLKAVPVESDGKISDIVNIELLKPSDFVNLDCISNPKEIGATLDLPEESPAPTVTSNEPENLIEEGAVGEDASSVSVEALCSEDASSVSVEALCSESTDAITSSCDILSSTGGTIVSVDSTSNSIDENPSITTSMDTSGQDGCFGVSGSVPSCPVMGINIVDDAEQVLDTVVVAMANMNLNSDFNDLLSPVAGTMESSGDTVFSDAVALRTSSDDSIERDYQVVDEPAAAEVTMTVHAITSNLPTSDSNLSPDQIPGSVPQVTPDSGPLLLRPDQFVTLSTAVDPHQVQQALQNTLSLVDTSDLIPLD
ncbi:hypothetical protein GE061_007324 [Apolygus lucorum]|uniref:Uncharacterized protein n=1 Tax=Apolygus lucorum TaxID=248454 RepID=A0A6A4J063_APOLU|nr:hypothetical protein GE061_007324 [Apolygus lucorum]